MDYNEFVKPNFNVEYWLHYCRGLAGQSREEYLDFLSFPIHNNLKFKDTYKQDIDLVDAIASLLNSFSPDEDDILEDLLEEIFSDDDEDEDEDDGW